MFADAVGAVALDDGADAVELLSKIILVIFVVSSMLALGLSEPLAAVVAPLRRVRLIALTLLVNFVAAPILALALSRLVPLQPAHADGLLLLGAAAGSPFLPKLAQVGRGSVPFALSLMVLQMVVSIVFMPVALPYFIPDVQVDPLHIALPLVVLMLLPLASRSPIRARPGCGVLKLPPTGFRTRRSPCLRCS